MVQGRSLTIRQRVQMVDERRKQSRMADFEVAKTRQEEASVRSGNYILGRDEEGCPKGTSAPSSLGITVNSWHVTIGFKRESSKKVKNLSVADVENAMRQGRLPRKTVKMSTHIIAAVRMLKHVRENYEQELSRKDLFLSYLDSLNITIAEKKSRATDKEIGDLVGELEQVRKWLKHRKLAIHRVVNRQRLDDTIKAFEEAKEVTGGQRGVLLARACARFTALRARLGEWRDKQIAGLAEHSHRRECSLRVERDQWLFSQFAKYTRISRKLQGYIEEDERKKEKIELVKQHLEKGENTPAMRCLWANRKLLTGELTSGYIKGDAGVIHRHIKNGRIDKAMEKIEYYILYTMANKPAYIMEELCKDREFYLDPVISSLEMAVNAMDAQDFKTAQEYFVLAARDMRAIVYG